MTRGILAGLIATAVLAGLLVANAVYAVVPQPEFIYGLRTIIGRGVVAASPATAWIAFFVIGGVIFGIIFAAIDPVLPGSGFWGGLIFGIFTWLLMMLIFMPLTGHGVFGGGFRDAVIWSALGFNLVYGIVLGLVWAGLGEPEL